MHSPVIFKIKERNIEDAEKIAGQLLAIYSVDNTYFEANDIETSLESFKKDLLDGFNVEPYNKMKNDELELILRMRPGAIREEIEEKFNCEFICFDEPPWSESEIIKKIISKVPDDMLPYYYPEISISSVSKIEISKNENKNVIISLGFYIDGGNWDYGSVVPSYELRLNSYQRDGGVGDFKCCHSDELYFVNEEFFRNNDLADGLYHFSYYITLDEEEDVCPDIKTEMPEDFFDDYPGFCYIVADIHT